MEAAEVQQLRVLVVALGDAIADLESQIRTAEARWGRRLKQRSDDVEVPARLTSLYCKLDEAQCLLVRLRAQAVSIAGCQ